MAGEVWVISGAFERLSGFFACPGNSHPHWTSLRARIYTSPGWADGKIDIKWLTRTAQQKTKILLSVLFALESAVIALLRRRSSVRILIWLAVWSGIYGARLLISARSIVSGLSGSLQGVLAAVDVIFGYLIVVAALLVWHEFLRGPLQLAIRISILAGLGIAAAGVGAFFLTGSKDAFLLYNNLLSVTASILFLMVLLFKPSSSFLVLPYRGVLLIGGLIFGAEALYANLPRLFHYRHIAILDHLGFAALLISLIVVAAQMIFANERRLFSIEVDLETARQIQASILPAGVPEIAGLNVAAFYQPMTAVAGDFYDFIPVDRYRAGFLVADVSGPDSAITRHQTSLFILLAALAAGFGVEARLLPLAPGRRHRGAGETGFTTGTFCPARFVPARPPRVPGREEPRSFGPAGNRSDWPG
jgi:hypothetical protein